jgi:hypothetical protein
MAPGDRALIFSEGEFIDEVVMGKVLKQEQP